MEHEKDAPAAGSAAGRLSPRTHGLGAPQRKQYAALPFRCVRDGRVEVLLITSRTTRRWIIPKGWPMGNRPPHKVAAREAAEEAGVEGRTGKRPLGYYHYTKVLAKGRLALCRVDVFALEVSKQRTTWPERKHRERRWLSPEEAASLIGDSELVPLVLAFMPPRALDA